MSVFEKPSQFKLTVNNMFFFGKSYEYHGKRGRIAPIVFQVLIILQEKGSLTGYAITKELNTRFQDLWKASFGTVVPLLKRLEEEWVCY